MRTPLILAALLALAACAPNEAPPPASRPELPVFGATTPATAPTPSGPKTSCPQVATADQVSKILNSAVTGGAHQVVGVAEPAIGRTARLDCFYGIPDNQPHTAASVVISMSTYATAQSAQARVTQTITASTAKGARAAEIPVAGTTGTLLTGDNRTLVVAEAARTVVITVPLTLFDDGQAPSLLAALAAKSLT